MSAWTYIVASIHVETYRRDKNIKNIVEDMLKNAPKITGSESDADLFVNVLSGHNVWSSEDGEYQTCVSINIVGNLRDRKKEQTKKEYSNFIKYITDNCEFDINNETVNIIDDWEIGEKFN